MINQRNESILKRENLTISPHDIKKDKEDSYSKRRFGSPVFYFHDCNGIQHYFFKQKDYRRKVLHVVLDFDRRSQEYPSYKRVFNLQNIIREYTGKARILTEKKIKDDRKYELRYEILFTANNNIKSFQYWIDELAYQILDNTIILFRELSLDVSTNPNYGKVIPATNYVRIGNNKIKPINDNFDKLNDFELATIGREYEKKEFLPPYELAVKLELGEDFFRKNEEYYRNETTLYAQNFMEKIINARVLKENVDMRKIVRFK